MSAVRFVLLAGVLACSPALIAADQPTAVDTSAAQKKYNDYMNEKVCESITVTGSRLGGKRICATRSEWAARRLQDRQAIDKLQTQLCTHDGDRC